MQAARALSEIRREWTGFLGGRRVGGGKQVGAEERAGGQLRFLDRP